MCASVRGSWAENPVKSAKAQDTNQPEADPKPDLSFVTTEQLVEELCNRHDGIIICRENCTDTKGQRHECMSDFSGGVSRAIGLAERMKWWLLNRGWERSDD